MKRAWIILFLPIVIWQGEVSARPGAAAGATSRDWKRTTIFIQEEYFSGPGETAASVLAEEVAKRTGYRWTISEKWPAEGNVIILGKAPGASGLPLQFNELPELPLKPESYRIGSQEEAGREFILVEGFDERGVLFGVGRLLRLMRFHENSMDLRVPLSVAASPEASIRGHQLGYRNTANSYDGWTPEFYEQYIRELAIFGANSIETIPFDRESPHFTLPPREMNIRISGICSRYGLDYWIWTPADFDLGDPLKKAEQLKETGQLYRELPRLDNVFFPGGDPGDNPPELVIPYLESLSVLLVKYHPKAKIWLSLQGFSAEMSEYVYRYIKAEMPEWLGGLVVGPGSPPLEETRAALPEQYGLRLYPDITHTVRCQYPVPWWDPAFNFTLGREPVNPRPYFYAGIYRQTAPLSDGFITYSDGVHDDLNKILWSLLGWDAGQDEREMVKEYASFFFGSGIAEEAADAILSLEKNWEGPIVANGSIEACLRLWQDIGAEKPGLSENWRWQMHLMRAYYDAYTRHRAIYESGLEQQVNDVLLHASETGPAAAMEAARALLSQADEHVKPEWRRQIIALCDALFQSVKLQTSVEKYQAKNPERGAVLDFLDRPLNNRWWLEDEFRRIDSLGDLQQQIKELKIIGSWESPAPGSYYDDVGNVSRSPQVIRGEGTGIPGFDWWESGYSRERLSWMVSMRWPEGIRYKNLDPQADYIVRVTGFGECLLRANGQRINASLYGKGVGEIREFPVPGELLKKGELLLTWDEIDEEHLNWRQHSRLNEVWLIRQRD
ncbi:MAG TPA: hypothetical protein VD772_02090 [Anseongella sp.]|nr:hypothetical protein [Anseongella sp.]